MTTSDTPITSSPGPTVAFRNEAQALTRSVAALKARGVDKIIALTHIGYAEDQALAAQVDGVDVFVGGHSHTFLETGNDKAAGPYPTVVKTPSGARLWSFRPAPTAPIWASWTSRSTPPAS